MQAIQALEQYTDAQEYLNSLKVGKDENGKDDFSDDEPAEEVEIDEIVIE